LSILEIRLVPDYYRVLIRVSSAAGRPRHLRFVSVDAVYVEVNAFVVIDNLSIICLLSLPLYVTSPSLSRGGEITIYIYTHVCGVGEGGGRGRGVGQCL
jgi:hypothetical protein